MYNVHVLHHRERVDAYTLSDHNSHDAVGHTCVALVGLRNECRRAERLGDALRVLKLIARRDRVCVFHYLFNYAHRARLYLQLFAHEFYTYRAALR